MPELRAPGIAETTLIFYLSGQQDGSEWALIDNLNPDEARDVAKKAITMLRQANACIALAAVALHPMEQRAVRLKVRDGANVMIESYLEDLSQRFGLA